MPPTPNPTEPFGARIISIVSLRCACLPRPAGTRGPFKAARVGVADRHARNRRAIAGFRSRRRANRCQGSLSAAPCILRRERHRQGAPDQALYEQLSREEASHIERAADIAASLGVTFSASGAASEPGMSFKRSVSGSPWTLCRRPWTVMYITANGRAFPAASHRSHSAATRITLSATLPSRPCGKFGAAKLTVFSQCTDVGEAPSRVCQLRSALELVSRAAAGEQRCCRHPDLQ